jgi:hypothetical protein
MKPITLQGPPHLEKLTVHSTTRIASGAQWVELVFPQEEGWGPSPTLYWSTETQEQHPLALSPECLLETGVW